MLKECYISLACINVSRFVALHSDTVTGYTQCRGLLSYWASCQFMLLLLMELGSPTINVQNGVSTVLAIRCTEAQVINCITIYNFIIFVQLDTIIDYYYNNYSTCYNYSYMYM